MFREVLGGRLSMWDLVLPVGPQSLLYMAQGSKILVSFKSRVISLVGRMIFNDLWKTPAPVLVKFLGPSQRRLPCMIIIFLSLLFFFFFWRALFSSYKYITSGSENVFLIKKTKLHSCLLWASRDSVGEVVVSFHIWPGLACLLCSLHTTCTDVFLWVLLLYLSTLMCRKQPRALSRTGERAGS